MKLQHPALAGLGGLSAAVVSRHWMASLEYQVAYYEPHVDPVHPDFRGPAVFLFWHEYIPFLFYLRGHCNIAMLLSRHHDAELLSRAARHMGFDTVRGSTNRGGVAALRTLFAKSRQMNLAITPDGPRGPRRRLAPGAVFLSSRLGIPLVPIGLGYAAAWRLPTWDRFAVPRPLSRARAIAGPAVQVPPGLDRDGLEHYRRRVQRLMNCLTGAAETWAVTGRRIEGQQPLRREGIPWYGRRKAHATPPVRRPAASDSAARAA